MEQGKMTLQEDINTMHDDWEDDFAYIENAEIKGQIVKLENLDHSDQFELGTQITPDVDQIIQAIKEEPAIEIEPDFEFKEEISWIDTKTHPYQCTECNKCFNSEASLISHTKALHSSSDSNDSDRKIQELALKPIFTQPNPQKTIVKCDLCNDSFAEGSELSAHRIICATKEKFYCDVCEVFVNSRFALNKHKQSKQHINYLNLPTAEERLKYVCVFCKERFPAQVLLSKHKKMHMEETQLLSETSRIERVDGRLTYICTICGRSSGNKSVHTEHLRVHTKEKLAKCDLCDLEFTTRSALMRHRPLHSDARPYKCNICDVTYRHRKNLRRHALKHTGQRPYKCQYCGRTFTLKYTCTNHVRLMHTGETPYQCEACTESFKTSQLLNLHRRQAHNIDTHTKRRVPILNHAVEPNQSSEN